MKENHTGLERHEGKWTTIRITFYFSANMIKRIKAD